MKKIVIWGIIGGLNTDPAEGGEMPKKSVIHAPNQLQKVQRIFDLDTADLARIFGVSCATVQVWLKHSAPTLHMRPNNARKLIGLTTTTKYMNSLLIEGDHAHLWFHMEIPSLSSKTPYELAVLDRIGELNVYLERVYIDQMVDGD